MLPDRKPNIPDRVRHLDLERVEEVLVSTRANVTASARILGVPTSDLRRLVILDPRLANAVLEAEERRLDRAEEILDEALASNDSRRRDAAASFVLRNQRRARSRGWGQTESLDNAVGRPPAHANTVVTWGNGEVIARFGPNGEHLPLIEHEPAAEDANTAAE
jgi:hypothetical protein